jgi:hypothetical protein
MFLVGLSTDAKMPSNMTTYKQAFLPTIIDSFLGQSIEIEELFHTLIKLLKAS